MECRKLQATAGGAAEAVLDGVTGYVMSNPTDASGLAARIATILDDGFLRASMAVASRARAETEFEYSVLATRLGQVLKVGQ